MGNVSFRRNTQHLETLDTLTTNKSKKLLPTIAQRANRNLREVSVYATATTTLEPPAHGHESPIKPTILKPVDMSKQTARFKDQEQQYLNRETRKWEKTHKALQKMGIVKKKRFDRLLLEELGLAEYFSDGGSSEDE